MGQQQDNTLQLQEIMGLYHIGDPDQSYTPDPPSQASDQPSQGSDVGFTIEELQNSSTVTQSLQASVATDDCAGLDVGEALSERGMVESGDGMTAGVAGFHGGRHMMSSPPSSVVPHTSSVVPHTPSLTCPNGTLVLPLVEEAESKSRVDDIVVQQSTPVSGRAVETISRQNDALNRVFDEIFAKRKMNSLTQSKESDGGVVPVPTTSTYVNLLGLQEGSKRREYPKVVQQDSGGRVHAEPADMCRLEDFVDYPPPRVQGGMATYESLCELGECSDQTVSVLDPGVGGSGGGGRS